MSEDDSAVLAMAASRMSVDSIAATMGWSRRRVETRLALLTTPPAEAKPAAPVVSMGDIAAGVAAAHKRARQDLADLFLRSLADAIPTLAAVQAVQGMHRLALGLAVAVQATPSMAEQVAKAAPAPASPQPPRRPPVAPPKPRPPRRPPALLGDRRGVETLKPLNARRLSFCRRFHAAGWPLEEIAWLFDAPEGDLAQALGVIQ